MNTHKNARAFLELGVRHKFPIPTGPQTNGKAERSIQSALREWAYGFIDQRSAQHPWSDEKDPEPTLLALHSSEGR